MIITKLLTFICLLAVSQVLSQSLQTTSFNGETYHKVGARWNLFDASSGQLIPISNKVLSVKFTTMPDAGTLSSFENQYNLSHIRTAVTRWADFYYNGSADIIAHCKNIGSHSLVEMVELSGPLDLTKIPNDSLVGHDPFTNTYDQYAIGITQLDDAWDKTTGDTNVVIASLDSGVDWLHEDFRQATATTGTFWVNKGEDAWSDISDPTTGDGIDNDGNGLVDDWLGYDFYRNGNDVSDMALNKGPHGTSVICISAASTNNSIGLAGVAGGWGAKPGARHMILKVYHDTNFGTLNDSLVAAGYDDAIEYAAKNGAKIIQASTHARTNYQQIEDMINWATEKYNVIFVISSGNDVSSSVYPIGKFKNSFSVAATDSNDRVYASSTGPTLDISAPGHAVPLADPDNNYIVNGGTSMASPFVAGVAGLMLSINPCLDNNEIADILRHRADKVNARDITTNPNGYFYGWNPSKPGHSRKIGYGRVNAKRAVDAADAMQSNSLDLYVKDHYSDFGYPDSYPDSSRFDDWSDIWVRNQPDGRDTMVMDDIEYSNQHPAWVYVRVRNKSCVASSGQDTLALYWTKASSVFSWPQNWDGSQPGVGSSIGFEVIPALEAGEDTIFEFEWTIAPELNVQSWGTCLMARINSAADPIAPDSNLAVEIRENNNIAIRNLKVLNIDPDSEPPVVNGTEYPYGNFVMVGNPHLEPAGPSVVNIHFDVPWQHSGSTITQDAEVRLLLSEELWQVFLSSNYQDHLGIEVTGERELTVVHPHARLRNLIFEAGQRPEMFVGFNFLTDAIDSTYHYRFHLTQYEGDQMQGAFNFNINRVKRDDFQADAGPDEIIYEGESTTLTAADINEPATYNWYDVNDSLIYSGKSPQLSPEATQKYKLEVIASADLYKDYDEVVINVNPYKIASLSPNPASSMVNVEYDAEEASSAYLMLYPVSGSTGYSYILQTQSSSTSVNISNYTPGVYSVILVCDGKIVDSQLLTIQ